MKFWVIKNSFIEIRFEDNDTSKDPSKLYIESSGSSSKFDLQFYNF